MQFLKTVAAALLVPIVAIVLLIALTLGFVVGYIAWLLGVPINVTVNGVKRKYRWLKPVESPFELALRRYGRR